MAEFCLECWNRINETNDTEDQYIISDGLELCEGCADMKRVIIRPKRDEDEFSYLFDWLFWPFKLIGLILLLLWRLFSLPFVLIVRRKRQNKTDG